MRTAPVQPGGVQHAIESLPDIRFVEGRAADGGEDPFRPWMASLQPGAPLPAAPEAKGDLQLPGEIDTPPLMVLRRGQEPAHEIPLDLNEAGSPIDVGPLQREELARSQAGAQPAEQPVCASDRESD